MAVQTQEGAQTRFHETRVIPSVRVVGTDKGRVYGARCWCGWRGPERRSMLSAVLDGDSHEERYGRPVS